jgi:hypothetical protein
MKYRAFFLGLLGINILILVLQIKGLSIGYNEAKILYDQSSFLSSIITLSLHLFGQNDYALRIPMILLHTLSVILLYGISKHYIEREVDRLWVILIYMLLPGVTSAALIVDNAGIVIASLFLFAYLYLRFGQYALGLLPLLVLIHPAFAYLFLALTLYGFYRKNPIFVITGILFLSISIFLYGTNIGGAPEGRFLDTIGLYAAICSPIVFLYLFYVLYRRLIGKEWDLIWMIAMSAFLISLLLSFRQKVEVQTFAPFLLLALPLAAQTFLRTYRVRLREFRGRYRLLFYSAFIILIINALIVFFNQWLYHFISNPTRHFSYPMHVAKELSGVLKHDHIKCINAQDDKLQLRLRFYEITQCNDYQLDKKEVPASKKVTISYKNIPVYVTYVTKINR